MPVMASAHELLPKEVIEYIKSNPEASPGQINAFIAKNAPDADTRVSDQQDIIEIANQKTNFADNTMDFIKLGFKHILGGYDHILFVLSLLLVFAGLRTVLKYTLTFTIAHSITLILAGSGLLTLSSNIVEPIIALSIAVLAISTVFFRKSKILKNPNAKLGIIFFFGLFHGLGFAGLLRDIQIPDDKFISSLLSFNIGIELGQLFIVALALPIIYILRKKSWYDNFIKVAAVIISILALYWMFERILG
jgi:hydrogenase/urease accessory protein HupE